jgi:hypothetical protein
MVFKVYYGSQSSDSGCKTFETQAEAEAWASKNRYREPVVVQVEETVVWHWRADA